MAYRLAKSLVTLRDQINQAAPNRATASDGWIGDQKHLKRKSEHNPNAAGVVTALDITHDPAHGVDGNAIAESAKLDPRVKYVIWNHKIWNSSIAKAWRKYTGSNPHTKHVHISTLPSKAKYDDTAAWVMKGIEEAGEAAADLPPAPEVPTLRLGSQGLWVRKLQTMLNASGAKPPLKVDGDYGPKTQAAVKSYQKAHGLTVDGVVGPYTWESLEKTAKPTILNKTTGEPATAPEQPAAVVTPPAPEAPPPAPAVPPSTPTEPVEVAGTPRWAVGYLISTGWPKVAAISLIAHIVWESGAARTFHQDWNAKSAIDWDAHGDKSSDDGEYHSHTALQLNDKHGRWQGYERFAADRGRPWDDPATILDWLNKEMASTERNVRSRLMDATTVSDGMKIAVDYWRPGKPHMDRRMAIAEKLEKEIG